LLKPLTEVYRSKERPESERSLATSILADYAADQPALLTELLLQATPGQHALLLPKVQLHRDFVLPRLTAELAKKPKHDWHDPPRPASWIPAEAASWQALDTAEGMCAERFAFCRTMPLDQFLRSAEALRKSGYRPIKFRPYRVNDAVQVAAVWTRDGQDWQITH